MADILISYSHGDPKGTFRADGTVIGETSAGTRVAQYSQTVADVRGP